MRSSTVVLLCLFATANSSFGQKDSTWAEALPKHQLKLSVFDMIDPFSPSFMLSYEQFLGANFSILAEGGYASSFNGNWLLRDKLEGYKLRGELRFFWTGAIPQTAFILGCRLCTSIL